MNADTIWYAVAGTAAASAAAGSFARVIFKSGQAAAKQSQLAERMDRVETKVDGLTEVVSRIDHMTTKNGGRNDPATLPDKLGTVIGQNEQILAGLAELGVKQVPKPRQPGDLFG